MRTYCKECFSFFCLKSTLESVVRKVARSVHPRSVSTERGRVCLSRKCQNVEHRLMGFGHMMARRHGAGSGPGDAQVSIPSQCCQRRGSVEGITREIF